MALIKESSKSASERPGLATGGLVAAMLTAALISVFYLAWKVVRLPFVPFDAFDWMARILPGQVLAAGIDAMITVIRAFNLGPTAAAAKTAEHVMAIAGMFFMGLFGAVILFSIIRAVRGRYAVYFGACLGNRPRYPAPVDQSAGGSDSQHGARVERDLGRRGSLVMGRDAWLDRSATPGWWQHGSWCGTGWSTCKREYRRTD